MTLEGLHRELASFWALVVDVWVNGVFGVNIGRIMVGVGIFFFFLILRRLFTRFVLDRLLRWTSTTATSRDEEIVEALRDPIRFIPVIMGLFFAIEYITPAGSLARFLDGVLRSLVVFDLFWAFFRLVPPLSFLLNPLIPMLGRPMVQWLVKASKAAVVFIGAAAVLDVWGIEIGPLIAGLGLFGVAVALGAQDLFKNLIAGILVLAEKRFSPGDWIRVDGIVEGIVEDIGFRSTLVRRFDKAPVWVPNARLSDNAVTNFSFMTHRRIYWTIGVAYRTTTQQLKQVRDGIESYILGNPDFAQPPEVATFVRVDRFGDSSIDIMLYCFTRTTNWGEWLAIKEKLAYEVKRVVEGAGTSFAFPSRSLYVETVPGDSPEPFTPPADKALPARAPAAE